MNYRNSAKVCLYNYFRDFGYEGDINGVDEYVDLDNCDNPLEFVKRLESIKLKTKISNLPLNGFKHEKDVPYFAICEAEKGKFLFLPIFLISKDFVTLKDSRGKTIRIKTSLFSKIYQGGIIEITDNKEFLKETFLRNEYQKRFLYGTIDAVSLLLFLTSSLIVMISMFSKNKFIDAVNVALYLSMAIFGILFFIFIFLFLRCQTKIDIVEKGRNKSYDNGMYYGSDSSENRSGSAELADVTIDIIFDILFRI